MERRLAAILAADVVGYTRLMGVDEAGTLRHLTELRQQVLEPLIAEHHGRVVKLMGDGLLVEFASVVDALTCAVAWQNDVAAQEAETDEDRRLQFRIGINLGDVIVEGEDIYGDGVNVAARIEGLAEPGSICMSRTVVNHVKGKVELDFEDMGEQNLKNVAEPVRVYRIAGDGSGTAAASPTKAPLPLPDKPSIAVMPFTNISGDPEQEYFADGITEDIITELSRFSSLFVIARNSSFTYKGQSVDIKKIARELGARYMLEGSIRRSKTRVRITAQLLDSDGGGHVWAEKYDRDLIDIFELQDEITRSVVSSIMPKIELAELERSRKLSDTGLTAYEQALKAQAYCYDALYVADPDLLNRAETAVNTALALDPRSIHALSIGSLIHMYRHMYSWGEDPEASLASSYKMAKNLIRIDSSNAKAYMIRAWVYVYQRKFDAAIAEHRRALSLNPNLAMNLFAMSWSEAVAGHTDQAREHAQLALQLSPQESDIWTGEGYAAIALANFFDGDYAGAVKFGHLAYQRQPVLQALMAAANGYLEDSRSAKFHIEELKDFAPRFLSTVLSGETKIFKHPEHNELLLKGLRRACRLETQPGGK